jgi:capsular polysaccharide biosynthesis protein
MTIMSYLKKILIFCKQKTKQLIIRCVQYLPIGSKYFGSVKGYYASSKDYWEICQFNHLNNVIYTPFLPASISKRNPPKSILKQHHWQFGGQHLHENPETFVISIPNGRVLNGINVVTHDDRLLIDVSLQYGIGRDVKKVKSHLTFNTLKFPKCEQIPETVALLATTGGYRYFHWLTDALPRLEILRKALPGGVEKIDKYIVNEGLPIITESLKMLDIPLDKLIFARSTQHIQAKNLIVPSLPGETGNPPAWVCNFLRDSFLPHRADIAPISKLYISRSKARYRRVINEEDVLECLSEHSFTPVWLEDHDFTTQIALLSNAEVIVAPHGAGLTNLIWCKAGAKVLEVFAPNYVNVCFWAIANQIGLEYFYLIGNGEKPLDYFDPERVLDDINVPIEDFRQSLEILLK